jgi:hypothetical protein
MNRQRRNALLAVLVAVLAFVDTDAFVTPKAFIAGSVTRTTTGSSLRNLPPLPIQMLPDNLELSSLLLSADDVDAEEMAMAMAAALGPLRTFFGVIAALVLLAAGLIYATPTFIVPAFAVQLEKDTKRLRPGLWEDYEAKLKEGEIMASRSDLLQELGDVMAPIIRGDFEDSAKKKDKLGETDEEQLPDGEVVLDPATISKKEAKKLKKKKKGSPPLK